MPTPHARGWRRALSSRATRALAIAACIAVVGGALVTHSSASSRPSAPAHRPDAPTGGSGRPSKVMVIVEENEPYGQVVGSPDAPYLNGLAATYGSATAMAAGYPTACPSLAAYILLTSGTTAGICDDQGPRHHPLAVDNIFAQVAAAGLTWRDYAESAPGPCPRNSSSDQVFLVRHTPAAYYLSEQARCPRWDIPLGTPASGALHQDVAAGTLPAYAFVSPNACDDMHTAPSCPGARVAGGDAWLARWMPQILGGPDFRSGRLVVIVTWDEGSETSNHIPTIVASTAVRHLTSSLPYTHCSTLATAEQILRLPLLGCAGAAPSLAAGFRLVR